MRWNNPALGAQLGGRELIIDDEVVIFSDGACTDNQDDRFRKAGCGAFWGIDHPLNIAVPLLGWSQTNQRAELQVVAHILERESRKMNIRSDSQYVIDIRNAVTVDIEVDRVWCAVSV